jgi:hypothetical protein
VPVAGFALFGSTGRDDAYITFWVAEGLASTGRIANYNGAAIEQSSSLLHVVVLAVLRRLTSLPMPTLAFWLGIIAAATCVPTAMAIARRIDRRAALPAGLFVATCGPAVYWAFGSLETPLATLALLAFLLATARVGERWCSAGVLAAVMATLVLVTARPEFGIIVAAAGVFAAAVRFGHPGSSTHAQRLGLVAAFIVAWSIVVGVLRIVLFGTWFPQPVMAKTALVARLNYSYVLATLTQSLTWGIVLLAGISSWRVRRDESRVLALVLATGMLGVCGVAASGGDWMECGRLLAPWLVVLSIGAGVAVAGIEPRRLRGAACAATVALGVSGELHYALRHSTGVPLGGEIRLFSPDDKPIPQVATLWPEVHNGPHNRDMVFVRSVEPILRQLVDEHHGPLVVASGQAGMVIYYLKRSFGDRLRFIDRRGLTTRDLDACGQSLPRVSPGGLPISYDWWFAHPELCGPPPDVIMDAGLFVQRSGIPERYRLALQQSGSVQRVGAFGRGGRQEGLNEFLAVRLDP